MTEKVLIEFSVYRTKGGYRYRYKRGKRAVVFHTPEGLSKGMWRCSKPSLTVRRDLRQALNTLEELYDELYPPENSE